MILLSFFVLYFLLGAFVAILFQPYTTQSWWTILLTPQSRWIVMIFLLVSLMIVLTAVFFGGKLSLAGTKAVRVTEDSEDLRAKQLYNIVEEMKIAAGLRYMPAIYIMPVGYMNAFASGWHEKNAVLAVTRPLLEALNREELQAVIAHEISHIRHQDTRVMTLVSVLASVLVMMIDIIFRSVLYSKPRRGRRNDASGLLVIVIMVIRILLPILTAFMVMYVSRKREFLADAGCVALTRNNLGLASALRKIHQGHTMHEKDVQEAYEQTPNESVRSLAYIYSPRKSGIRNFLNVHEWFSTHPPLKERLEALGVKDGEDAS